MKLAATLLGLCAVAMFVGSYQLKSRRMLILFNAGSRVLYVAQYLLLGALDGALLDVVAFAVSMLCRDRDRGFVKKHFILTVILCNAAVIGAGMLTYRNVFSMLAILGVLFETLALWLARERHIRLASLLGAPFWLAYNVRNAAYGSVIGNVITLVSITVAIIRYDVLKKEKGRAGGGAPPSFAVGAPSSFSRRSVAAVYTD